MICVCVCIFVCMYVCVKFQLPNPTNSPCSQLLCGVSAKVSPRLMGLAARSSVVTQRSAVLIFYLSVRKGVIRGRPLRQTRRGASLARRARQPLVPRHFFSVNSASSRRHCLFPAFTVHPWCFSGIVLCGIKLASARSVGSTPSMCGTSLRRRR